MSQNNYNIRIVGSLLSSENHIRGLAEKLNTNQTTIARKVKDLQDKNVVDFRQQGKNKVIFLKNSLEAKQYAYQFEAQKLIDAVEKYPFLRRLIEELKNNKMVTIAILFGSYAKFNAKKDSDIDIFIDTKDKQIKEDIEQLDSRINVKIGRYDKESILIKEIEKNHVIIKGVEEYYEKNKFFE